MKKISIITINYNNKTGLRKTIESVITQSQIRSIEYVIIDGGSNDGSHSILEEFRQNIDVIISEPDNGIYNAMNKGIANSHCEYTLFLNSGDTLYNNHSIENILAHNLDSDIICFGIEAYNGSEKWRILPPTKISLFSLLHSSLMHQSTLISKSILESVGGYNESYRTCSDWIFFVEALIIKNCSYSYFDDIVSCFDATGISSTCVATDEHCKAHQFLIEKFPRILPDYEIITPEHIYNVLYFISLNKYKKSLLLFICKVFNRIFHLRNKVGVRTRIGKRGRIV